jgi:hypothetical protein
MLSFFLRNCRSWPIRKSKSGKSGDTWDWCWATRSKQWKSDYRAGKPTGESTGSVSCASSQLSITARTPECLSAESTARRPTFRCCPAATLSTDTIPLPSFRPSNNYSSPTSNAGRVRPFPSTSSWPSTHIPPTTRNKNSRMPRYWPYQSYSKEFGCCIYRTTARRDSCASIFWLPA